MARSRRRIQPTRRLRQIEGRSAPMRRTRLSRTVVLWTWIEAGIIAVVAARPSGADAPEPTWTGAQRQPWSFVPPKRPAVPAENRGAWVRNPIDAFILRDLGRFGLPPAPEADRATLIRRLRFDLTGLPPTP